MNPQLPGSVERAVIITREFAAPRQLVFRAWTDPEHIVQWWGPRGFTSFDCQIDLRVGGRFCLQMRGLDDVVYPCWGEFREIVVPEKLVYAGPAEGPPCGAGVPPRAVVTVTFVERDGKTILTIHTQLETISDHAAAVQAGVLPGWEMTMDRLTEFLRQEGKN